MNYLNFDNAGPKRSKVLTASDVLEGAFLEDGGGDDGDLDRDRGGDREREGSDDESGETTQYRQMPYLRFSEIVLNFLVTPKITEIVQKKLTI